MVADKAPGSWCATRAARLGVLGAGLCRGRPARAVVAGGWVPPGAGVCVCWGLVAVRLRVLLSFLVHCARRAVGVERAMVRLLAFDEMLSRLSPLARRASARAETIPEGWIASVAEFYAYLFPRVWRRRCLFRSLLILDWARRVGLNPTLNVGMRLAPDRDQGHCWLSLGNRAFCEPGGGWPGRYGSLFHSDANVRYWAAVVQDPTGLGRMGTLPTAGGALISSVISEPMCRGSATFRDPVSSWLEARSERLEARGRSVHFLFNEERIVVWSNSVEVLTHLRRHVAAHYPRPTSESIRRRTCRVDIYVVATGRDGQIVLPVEEGAGMLDAVDVPSPHATVLSDEFVHMRWDDVEAFWRPFDLLASLRLSPMAHIRILVGGHPSGARHSRPGALRLKVDRVAAHGSTASDEVGPRSGGPLALDEIADLVRTMIVRAQGHFCLHAATVASGERGAILLGPSGSGKTTTALALMRGGFDLLSDENSLLSAVKCRIQVAGFRVPPRIVGRAPTTLDELEGTLSHGGHGKSEMALPKTAARGRGTHWVSPAAMFFLRIRRGADDHTVTPMAPEEAFVLATDQVLDPTNVFRREEQAQALISLVEKCPAYELVLGRNISSLPALIHRIMGGDA